ncbi:hypothetical protein DV704_05530 [Meiothermus sp. QL-1]|uniref:E3 binding domain-containing protein n=1 Tax=Meiothermus sp. QL-1 TaxID=2058095 RepID=UPI000E0BA8A5|nr:E3 binding domain-containing protein [Meiothermus sp. QL-1]RDI95734.1 hypothetical protein DV704_05530 [Meiothermus sp. QL-1]
MSEAKITPLARRLAEENGIDWRQIQGTGPDGTVVERDILSFLAKVMAGEVNLPPTPEEAQPLPEPLTEKAMAQAQAVLQKEGLQIGDLVPPSVQPTALDIEFDLDLETLPQDHPIFEEETPPAPDPSPVLDLAEPEPLVASEPLPQLEWEEPPPNPELAGLPPLPPDEEPAPNPPVVPPAPPPGPSPALAQPSSPAALAETGIQGVRVQAWQRMVVLGPAQEAAQTLSEAWGTEVDLYPLLFRAVERALAQLELGWQPVKGLLEGEQLKRFRVAPAQSLRGTLEALRQASEPGEGLVVLSLLDTPFDQVVFPNVPTLTLGRAQGGLALLALSGGIEPALAGELLEQVARHLERPILLA